MSMITNGLVELLHCEREPYVPITLTLNQARALDDNEKANLGDTIRRLAPAGDLKQLAKKWDRYNRALASAAQARMAAGLFSLLNGNAEPVSRP